MVKGLLPEIGSSLKNLRISSNKEPRDSQTGLRITITARQRAKMSVTSSCHFDLDSDELQKEIGQLFSLIV